MTTERNAAFSSPDVTLTVTTRGGERVGAGWWAC